MLYLAGSAIPQCDIYSIGILILEILAKKEFAHRGKLLNWVRGRTLVKGKVRNIKKVIRKNLRVRSCNNIKIARKAIKLGLQCACDKTSDRPTIDFVCKELNKLVEMEPYFFSCFGLTMP